MKILLATIAIALITIALALVGIFVALRKPDLTDIPTESEYQLVSSSWYIGYDGKAPWEVGRWQIQIANNNPNRTLCMFRYHTVYYDENNKKVMGGNSNGIILKWFTLAPC